MFNITKNASNITSTPCQGKYQDATTYNCLKQITDVLETFILLNFKTGISVSPTTGNTAVDMYNDEFKFRLFTIYLQTVILSLIFTIYTKGSKITQVNIDYYNTIIRSINNDSYKLGKKYLDICLLQHFSFDNINQNNLTDKVTDIKVKLQGEILGYIGASLKGLKEEFAYFYFPYINIDNVSSSIKKQINLLAPRDQGVNDVRKIHSRIPDIPYDVNGSNITPDLIDDYTNKLMNVVSAIIKLMGVVKNVELVNPNPNNPYLNGGPTISYAIMLLIQIPNIIVMLFILKIGLVPLEGDGIKLSDDFLNQDVSNHEELCKFITDMNINPTVNHVDACENTTYNELIKLMIEPDDPTSIDEIIRYRAVSLIIKKYIANYTEFNTTPLSKQIIQTKIYGMMICYPQIYYTTSFWNSINGNITDNMLNPNCENMNRYLDLISHDRNWTRSLSPVLIGDKLNNCNVNVPLTLANLSQVGTNPKSVTPDNIADTTQTPSIRITMGSNSTYSSSIDNKTNPSMAVSSSVPSSISSSISSLQSSQSSQPSQPSSSMSSSISSISSPSFAVSSIENSSGIDDLFDTFNTNDIPSPDDGLSITNQPFIDEFNSQYNTLSVVSQNNSNTVIDDDDDDTTTTSINTNNNTNNNNSGIVKNIAKQEYGVSSDINKLADEFSKNFIAIIDNLQIMIKDARNNNISNMNNQKPPNPTPIVVPSSITFTSPPTSPTITSPPTSPSSSTSSSSSTNSTGSTISTISTNPTISTIYTNSTTPTSHTPMNVPGSNNTPPTPSAPVAPINNSPPTSHTPMNVPGSNNTPPTPSAPIAPINNNPPTSPSPAIVPDNTSLLTTNVTNTDGSQNSEINNTSSGINDINSVDDDLKNYKTEVEENIKKIKDRLENLKYRLGNKTIKLFKDDSSKVSIQQSYTKISRQLIENIDIFMRLLTFINVNIDKIGIDHSILETLKFISGEPDYVITSGGMIVGKFYNRINKDYAKLYAEVYNLNVNSHTYPVKLNDIVYGGGFTYKNNLRKSNNKTKRTRYQHKKEYYY